MAQPTPVASWADAPATLLALASADLDTDVAPAPTLLAFEGDTALATATLRPFEAGELVPALIELLALLLPLGADRLALSLPGRAWSTHDPIPPVTKAADLRQRVLVVTLADGRSCPAQVSCRLHTIDERPDGSRRAQALDTEADMDAPVLRALELLLDARDELYGGADTDLRIAAQLGRVLLAGHLLALSPLAAERLEIHSVGV